MTTPIVTCNARLFRAAMRSQSNPGGGRFYLQGVHVQPHPCGGVYLIATDGHRMTVIHDRDGTATRPATVAWEAKASDLTGRKSEPARTLILTDDDAVKIHDADGTPLTPRGGYEVIGTFPDWTRVIPSELAPSVPAFNPKYLKDIADALQDATGERPGLTFATSADATGATLIKPVSDAPIFWILMPMRHDGTAAELPAWVGAKPYTTPAVSVTLDESAPAFTVESRTCPLSESSARRYCFADAHTMRRAYGKLHARLIARKPGIDLPDVPAPVSPLSPRYLSSLQTRAARIADALEVFAAAEASELEEPLHRKTWLRLERPGYLRPWTDPTPAIAPNPPCATATPADAHRHMRMTTPRGTRTGFRYLAA